MEESYSIGFLWVFRVGESLGSGVFNGVNLKVVVLRDDLVVEVYVFNFIELTVDEVFIDELRVKVVKVVGLGYVLYLDYCTNVKELNKDFKVRFLLSVFKDFSFMIETLVGPCRDEFEIALAKF